MLATFRCDEIIRGINEKMADHVKQLQTSVCCIIMMVALSIHVSSYDACTYTLIGVWWIS